MTIRFKPKYTIYPDFILAPTKEDVKKFYKDATELYENFCSPDTTHKDPSESLEMFFEIANMWRHLMGNSSDVWYEGDKLIAQAIGTTIMYWDTDIVDQLDFCEELAKLGGLDFKENEET